MTLYMAHTAIRYSAHRTMYGAYVIEAETFEKAEELLENSGTLLDDKPAAYEEILRTQVLDSTTPDPRIAMVHFGTQTMEI